MAHLNAAMETRDYIILSNRHVWPEYGYQTVMILLGLPQFAIHH